MSITREEKASSQILADKVECVTRAPHITERKIAYLYRVDTAVHSRNV